MQYQQAYQAAAQVIKVAAKKLASRRSGSTSLPAPVNKFLAAPTGESWTVRAVILASVAIGQFLLLDRRIHYR